MKHVMQLVGKLGIRFAGVPLPAVLVNLPGGTENSRTVRRVANNFRPFRHQAPVPFHQPPGSLLFQIGFRLFQLPGGLCHILY